MKPYASSCDQNKSPILAILKEILADKQTVLEVGSGTGQHAVHFAKELPHLTWQCSDQAQHHQGMQLWLDEANLPNVASPLALNVSTDKWPEEQYDAIYSANITHIMSWENVIAFFLNGTQCLKPKGIFIFYGPFNYSGQYTSVGNEAFDKHLKAGDPLSGIRDIDDLQNLAIDNALTLLSDYDMPANNRILVWQKQ